VSLTQKQENFCLEYIKCGNASEAYRRAYNAGKMKDTTITSKAYELMKNGEVTAMISKLKLRAESKAIITLEQRKELLSRFAWEEETDKAMKAIDLLNKMESIYVQKQQTELSGAVGVTYYAPEKDDTA
jgi:phage terminase small subunit